MAAKKNDSNTLIFYRSFYDMLQEVEDPVARSAAYDAICAYAFFGRKPKTSNTFVKMVFHAAQPLIDANDKRRANGKKGGRKAKTELQTAGRAETKSAAEKSRRAKKDEETATSDNRQRQSQTELALLEKTEPAVLQGTEPSEPTEAVLEQICKPDTDTDTDVDVDVDVDTDVDTDVDADRDTDADTDMDGDAAADHHHHGDDDIDPDPDAAVQPACGCDDMVAAVAGGACGVGESCSREPQMIFYYSREEFPTTQRELDRFRAYTRALFQRYHRTASEDDVENVFLRIYRRVEIANGAIAAFDAEKAKLLSYAFEQASAAGKLNWRYIGGMYRNFEQRDITTVSEALQYDLERSQRIAAQ